MGHSKQQNEVLQSFWVSYWIPSALAMQTAEIDFKISATSLLPQIFGGFPCPLLPQPLPKNYKHFIPRIKSPPAWNTYSDFCFLATSWLIHPREWKFIIETKYYMEVHYILCTPEFVVLIHTYSLHHKQLNHCYLINSNASSSISLHCHSDSLNRSNLILKSM